MHKAGKKKCIRICFGSYNFLRHKHSCALDVLLLDYFGIYGCYITKHADIDITLQSTGTKKRTLWSWEVSEKLLKSL